MFSFLMPRRKAQPELSSTLVERLLECHWGLDKATRKKLIKRMVARALDPEASTREGTMAFEALLHAEEVGLEAVQTLMKGAEIKQQLEQQRRAAEEQEIGTDTLAAAVAELLESRPAPEVIPSDQSGRNPSGPRLVDPIAGVEIA